MKSVYFWNNFSLATKFVSLLVIKISLLTIPVIRQSCFRIWSPDVHVLVRSD